MKSQFKRFSKSTLSVVLAFCMLVSCMTVGLIATDAAQTVAERVGAVDNSEGVGTTIPSGTTFYLDVTNFDGDYDTGEYYMSLSENGSYVANKDDTSGVGSYVPKNDTSWVQMTKVKGKLYSATTTAQNTNGRISFWSKNGSSYNDVWEMDVSLGNAYDSSKTVFTISSGSTKHDDRHASCFSGTWSAYNPDNYTMGTCPASVLNGTDIMFYIQGHDGLNKLANSSKTVSPGEFTQADGSKFSYVKVAKSTAGNYQYITNNPGSWLGNQNTSIGSDSAGKLHRADGTTSTTAAKTATTNPSTTSITTGTASITLNTTCNSTTGVYNNLPLYYQYYLDDTYVASSEKSAQTTEQSFTLDTASLTEGSHTVKTVLTDGNIFYIADTETITVSDAVVPSIDTFTIGSSTLNIGETTTISSTKSNSSDSVTYAVTTGADVISLTGTTVKALKPGSATITASLTGATSKTVTVTVRTPTLTVTYDPASIYVGGDSTSAPTVTATNVNADTTISSKSFTKSGSAGTINASTGVVTSSTSTTGNVTVTATATVSYNGVTYTGATGTATVTVSDPPSVYFKYDQTGGITTKGLSGTKMTYDNASGLYKYSVNLNKGSGDGNWYYIVIYDESETHNLSYNNGTLTESLTTGSGFTIYDGDNNVNHPLHIVASVTGTYNFYFNSNTNTIYVECPHTVTLDKNGMTTTAWPGSNPVATYGQKATAPTTTPAATGYTFGGWYKENGCTNLFDFSTEVITADTTVYAKWTRNSHSINYTTGTGFRYSNNSTTSAHYQDTVSFTVTAESGYRITGVKYTPLGGSAQNCNADSNNTYSFTMPDADVEISVTTVKTYTVTLNAGTGIDTKQYRKGTSGNYTDYSQTITVDTGSTVQLKVSYSTGYEYDSSNSSLDGATTSDHLTFTLSNITSNKSVTITAKKTDYQLTGVTSPTGKGSVKFYSDLSCEQQINPAVANYGNTVYAKYDPGESGYVLKSFSVSGTGASLGTRNGNVIPVTVGYEDVTVTATVVLQYSVTYYVDMHGNEINSLSFAVVAKTGTNTYSVIKDNENDDCIATLGNAQGKYQLTKQGSSNVYAATITTPVTLSGSTYSDLYFRITFNGTDYIKKISGGNTSATNCIVDDLINSGEIWLEAENESSQTLNINYSTAFNPESGSTPAVDIGYRRIYLAKPYSWQNDNPDNWKNIKVYHWGNYNDMGWNSGLPMTYLGYGKMPGADSESTDVYHYYYIDLPKYVNQDRTLNLNTDGTGNKVQNIIFQGWADNATSPSVQTGNIEKIPDSANFYILSKDGSAYNGTASDSSVVIPTFARRASNVAMNVGQTGVNIAPVNTGAKVTYTSSNPSKVSVSDTGDITASASTVGETNNIVTITVKVYGSIGEKISDTENGGGEPHNGADAVIYTVRVSVHDPSQFNGFEIMSLESKTYEVKIPNLDSNGEPVDTGGTLPGYFDMSNVVMTVEGIHGVTSSTSSAIITQTSTASVTGVGTVCTAFTVKYAKANSDFTGYNNIRITGKTVTKSIKIQGDERYGHDHWEVDDVQDDTIITTRKIYSGTDTSQVGIETATTNGIPFDDTKATYSDIFAAYSYVDVTFTFSYYEYNPELSEDGMINYPYESTWAGTETIGNTFNKKVFTVTELVDGTVKGSWAANGSAGASTPCVTLDISAVSSSGGNWCAWTWGESDGRWIEGTKSGNIITFADNDVDNNIIFVRMNAGDAMNWNNAQNKTADLSSRSHNLKTVTVSNYEVRGKTADTVQPSDLVTPALTAIGVRPDNNYYNYSIAAGNITIPESDRDRDHFTANAAVNIAHSVKHYSVYLNGSTIVGTDYTYQQYVEVAPTNQPSDTLWYAVGKNSTAVDTSTDPLLATGSSYKFRVKGNTYLRTVEGSVTDQNFNRSEVDFSHYEVTHQGSNSENMKEYLMQNFYIADFFSPAEVLSDRPKEGGGFLPYDDAQFVGGGVVYYSVTNGTPFANAVSSGYVGNDGIINANAIKEMLKSNIEAQYAKDNIAGAVGENEAMKIAYGTEIAATKNKEGGFNTGIIYRYLPLNQYKRDGNGTLLAPDQDGNYAYDVNTNTFRYSNSLQSYQYVYASGNENKATNAGKNMRLYSYYVYSYVTYDQETNVPVTKYEIVISDNYSDASTYWAGNPNP